MGQSSGRIRRQCNNKNAETEKIKGREQTVEILRKFFFCILWPKKARTNIIGVLMTAAAREDKEFKLRPKIKNIISREEPRTASHQSDWSMWC